MTSRIHRGFHRIGIVLATPVLLIGIGLAGHEACLQWTTKDPWAAFPIVESAPKKPANSFDKFVLPSDADNFVFPSEAAAGRSSPYAANYTLATLALGVALALYVAARTIGWVLAGFLSPGR